MFPFCVLGYADVHTSVEIQNLFNKWLEKLVEKHLDT